MQYRFHVNVFARPSGKIFDAYFPVSFEQAVEALLKLPRHDVEPDGFFVFAGGAGPTLWRVSGHLYDFGGRLHRMELNGACPAESFDALLACVGWPATELVFELVEQGITLAETDFRAWASEASRAIPAPAPPD